MTEKNINDIAEIEDAQAALRESIEATKELSERAEYLLQHGMIDMVVPRQQLKETLAKVIGYLMPEKKAA